MTLDEAIKHCEEVAESHTKYNSYGGYESCDECAADHRQLAEWLTELKERREQPVKRGKWEYYKNNGIYDTYKCSICKESFELPMDADISQEMRYCPHCGAKMTKQ